MLTKDTEKQINALYEQYAPFKADLPHWKENHTLLNHFPDACDLKYIASKVQPLCLKSPSEPYLKNAKIFVKHLYVRWVQPKLQKIFKDQMLFNEYIWLLANTVALQNQKIEALEEKINELKKKNTN